MARKYTRKASRRSASRRSHRRQTRKVGGGNEENGVLVNGRRMIPKGLKCPACGARIGKLGTIFMGEEVKCPFCGHKFIRR
jgi:DNA-directed RNA polymerase subunit RPC12/RpoP